MSPLSQKGQAGAAHQGLQSRQELRPYLRSIPLLENVENRGRGKALSRS